MHAQKKRRSQTAAAEQQVVAVTDCEYETADELFKPFPIEHFTFSLQSSVLRGLLNTAPTTAVPMPPKFSRLASWPPGPPSELQYVTFWIDIGSCLPSHAAKVLSLDALCQRHVNNDDTITVENKKRGFMVLVKGAMVVGGEDMATEGQFNECMQDLVDKHAGSSSALYGRLQYILLVAMTGRQMSVHAISVAPADRGEPLRPVTLVEKFDVVPRHGRRKALRVWINITRWLRTVHDSDALPPKPRHPLFEGFTRPSPYRALCPEEYEDEVVSLKIGLRVVAKKFMLPRSRLELLVEVYKLLDHLNLATAVKCVRLKVDGREVNLKQDGTPWTKGWDSVMIELTFKPVGAQWDNPDAQDLKVLAKGLLTTLNGVHAAGVVHRDIRRQNIVRSSDDWVLIDWELAGRAGEKVWWRSDNLPVWVADGSEPYTVQTDLWQVGRLILSLCSRNSSLRAIAAGLQSGVYTSALEAADAIQL